MRTNQAVTCPAQECARLESYGGGRRGKRPLPRGPAPGLTRSRFHPAQPFPLPLGAAPHRPINHPVIEGDLLAQHPESLLPFRGQRLHREVSGRGWAEYPRADGHTSAPVGVISRSGRSLPGRRPAANGHPERDAELRVALARRPVRQRTAVFLGYYARTEPRASRRAGEPAQRERNYRERLTKVCLARRLGTGRSVRDASTIGLAAVEDEPSGPWCSGSPLGILGS